MSTRSNVLGALSQCAAALAKWQEFARANYAPGDISWYIEAAEALDAARNILRAPRPAPRPPVEILAEALRECVTAEGAACLAYGTDTPALRRRLAAINTIARAALAAAGVQP